MKALSGFLFFLAFVPTFPSAPSQIAADPDHFGFGLAWNGAEQARLGQEFVLGPLSIGGLVEIRNEPRFNQGPFPNHNWKGFFSAKLSHTLNRDSSKPLSAHLGYQHESAHPTMGIMEPTIKPYELVYDGLWRTLNLNAIQAGLSRNIRRGRVEGFAEARGLYYFSSRNQPELYNNALGSSFGIAAGANPIFRIDSLNGIYFSLFFRTLFEGDKKARGLVWVEGPDRAALQRMTDYPVITETRTAVVRAGFLRRLTALPYSLDCYALVLRGHPGGFIDSRDRRTEFRAGFELR